jgi:hypothetical protein
MLGLLFVLLAAFDLWHYGRGRLDWLRSLSMSLAFLAAAPLQEPSRNGLSWRQQLRTPYGLLSLAAIVVNFGLRFVHFG